MKERVYQKGMGVSWGSVYVGKKESLRGFKNGT
jgi:hypothetical protein